MHDEIGHILKMHDSMSKRLVQARKKARYTDAKSAATAIGVNMHTYIQHENGTRGFARSAERYAKFFHVDVGWLLTGKGSSTAQGLQVPVVGYVGAGAEVYPFDDHAMGDGLEQVSVSNVPDDAVGLIVRGDSMYPFEDGWVIFYRRDRDGVPSKCINQLCVIRVANDGPTLVKKLRRGSKPKHYNLESWNGPLREDTELEWAAPVLSILPR